jgi:SchA/CurD like domain
MQRHALAFRVRPSSEEAVAQLLGGYDPPILRVDEHTRLLATAVFMLGNHVVRCMEIEGDLRAAARHIADDPRVRAVEEQLHRHLEQPYPRDGAADRQSFVRERLMTRLAHVQLDAPPPFPAARRHALRLPVAPGAARRKGETLARAGLPHGTVGRARVWDASLFVQGDDTLVLVLTVEGAIEDVVSALGMPGVESFRTVLERDPHRSAGNGPGRPAPTDDLEEVRS